MLSGISVEGRCLDCGRSIDGPMVTTPDGDTYHYACVSIEYPKPSGTDNLLSRLDEEESPLYGFFKMLDENPYESLAKLNNNAPETYVELNNETTISVLGRDLLEIETTGSSDNINPILLQTVAFGWAMERDYPAFADRDELYPDGNPRVAPEEEQVLGSGD